MIKKTVRTKDPTNLEGRRRGKVPQANRLIVGAAGQSEPVAGPSHGSSGRLVLSEGAQYALRLDIDHLAQNKEERSSGCCLTKK